MICARLCLKTISSFLYYFLFFSTCSGTNLNQMLKQKIIGSLWKTLHLHVRFLALLTSRGNE